MNTNSGDRLRLKLTAVGSLLAVLGLLFSLYTVYHHLELKSLGETDFACNINDKLSCDKVADSKYSEVFGQPLGVWGAGYFLGLLLLLGLSWFKKESRREALHTYAVLTGIGLVVSVVLGSISAFVIGYGCIVCIGIYGVTLLQALALWLFKGAIPGGMTAKGLFNGGTVGAIGVMVAVIGFNFFKPNINELATNKPASENAPPVMELLPNVNEIKINRSDYSGLGQDYRKGSDNAKVIVVEYADFECPACANTSTVLRELADEFGEKISIVFKNYPLNKNCNPEMQNDMHKHACKIAVMARCAGQFGKFWEYHNLAFDNQKDASEAAALKWGKQVGLSDGQMKECQANPAIVAKIKDDAGQGGKLAIDSTPTIFINGRKFIGSRSKSGLSEQIQNLLSE